MPRAKPDGSKAKFVAAEIHDRASETQRHANETQRYLFELLEATFIKKTPWEREKAMKTIIAAMKSNSGVLETNSELIEIASELRNGNLIEAETIAMNLLRREK